MMKNFNAQVNQNEQINSHVSVRTNNNSVIVQAPAVGIDDSVLFSEEKAVQKVKTLVSKAVNDVRNHIKERSESVLSSFDRQAEDLEAKVEQLVFDIKEEKQ